MNTPEQMFIDNALLEFNLNLLSKKHTEGRKYRDIDGTLVYSPGMTSEEFTNAVMFSINHDTILLAKNAQYLRQRMMDGCDCEDEDEE